jgi:hypothetical protein
MQLCNFCFFWFSFFQGQKKKKQQQTLKMTASFLLSDSAPKEVKQALLELLETDANFRIALRAALRSTTPSPLSSTQLPTGHNNTTTNNNNNNNNNNSNSNATQMNSFASTRDGSKSYLSALAAVSKRKNSLQRSGTAAPTSPAPAPNSIAPTPPGVASPATAVPTNTLSPKARSDLFFFFFFSTTFHFSKRFCVV